MKAIRECVACDEAAFLLQVLGYKLIKTFNSTHVCNAQGESCVSLWYVDEIDFRTQDDWHQIRFKQLPTLLEAFE